MNDAKASELILQKTGFLWFLPSTLSLFMGGIVTKTENTVSNLFACMNVPGRFAWCNRFWFSNLLLKPLVYS
jgi:hypothetical protein